jgi:hypothetical protein
VPGVSVADDLVERRFRPAGPDVLWIADATYLRTWRASASCISPPSRTPTRGALSVSTIVRLPENSPTL